MEAPSAQCQTETVQLKFIEKISQVSTSKIKENKSRNIIEKVVAIQIPKEKTITELRSFLGMLQCCARSLPNLATTETPFYWLRINQGNRMKSNRGNMPNARRDLAMNHFCCTRTQKAHQSSYDISRVYSYLCTSNKMVTIGL